MPVREGTHFTLDAFPSLGDRSFRFILFFFFLQESAHPIPASRPWKYWALSSDYFVPYSNIGGPMLGIPIPSYIVFAASRPVCYHLARCRDVPVDAKGPRRLSPTSPPCFCIAPRVCRGPGRRTHPAEQPTQAQLTSSHPDTADNTVCAPFLPTPNRPGLSPEVLPVALLSPARRGSNAFILP